MRILRILGFSTLIAIPLHAEPLKPVALVYSLTGQASITAPARHPLRLFDRLPAGTALKTGPGSRVALAFANGLRYELSEEARVTLGRKDLTSRTGPVRPLPRVPPLPDLAPIAAADRPGPRAGAVRIRSETISGLYPDRGAISLASAVRLRFDPVPATPKYHVQIVDPKGKVLFRIDTQATVVSVPPRVLAPGGTYHWMVETRDRPAAVARGEASLVTLDASRARAREELRRWAQRSGAADDLRLLEGVDRALGLQEEPDDAAGDVRDPLSEPDSSGSTEAGVVVEEVTPQSLAARADLRAGDLLLTWCRAAVPPDNSCVSKGRFESPFDFEEMDLEQAPRGGVKVLGKRAAESRTWVLLPGSPSIRVRPRLPELLLRLDQENRDLTASRPEDAIGLWRSAAVQARQAGEDWLGVWFLTRGADALAEVRQWPQADSLYNEAVDQAQSLQEKKIEAQILKAWGKTFQSRGLWEKAEDLYRRSLELDQAAGRELAVAWSLDRLGTMAAQHKDPREAEALLQQALKILEEQAPRSSTVAASLRNLGEVMRLRGDLGSSELQLERALAILEDLVPGSLELADALTYMGRIRMDRWNLAGAEELFRRAMTLYERIRPESLEMAEALRNLGLTAVHRGDQETADYYLRRSLALHERLDSSGAGVASNLESLGLQAYERGDQEKAVEHLRRAVSLNEKLENGPALAKALQNLGVVVLRRGKGDCLTTEKYLQRALAIRQKLDPDGFSVASSLRSLGFQGLKCGDLSKAEENYRRALVLYERLTPGGTGQVKALHDLGWTYRQLGRSLLAEESLCRAADLSDWRGGSGQEVFDPRLFLDCLLARVETGRTAEAFHVLERGRARLFLKQLAERDLLFSADLPIEIARKRKQLANEIESTQGALARLNSTGKTAEAERLLNHLRETRDRQRQLTEEIRKSSPRFASVHYPEPLDLAGARRALDPGTVLLAYAVGEDKSYLFVIQSPEAQGSGFSVFPLAIGEEALRETVRSFSNLLQKKDLARSHLISRASGLYDLLIGPAEAQITAAKRILVSADGPLHTLPFAALVRKGRYLVEWKPLHSILSATAYAELKRTRRTSADRAQYQLVAFGDPIYPVLPKDREAAPAATLEILTAVRRGLSLDPIPATRNEVQSIASLYPGARVYLGAEATEERAKSVGSEARLLHFASHGLLNERFPLDSALALTIPKQPAEGQENGLLQAWEILEDVRLDADLVTLSACDTALGREMGGEGLVGLTRAFQYAGARSVLASLWSISDTSSADLMKRFYGYLRKGRGKDEALRAAQVDLIRSQDFAHPFYWAAFQLTGDWQ